MIVAIGASTQLISRRYWKQKMNDDIFTQADARVLKLLQTLENAQNYFPTVIVPRTLLKSGFTNYKGLVVPLKSVSHRYLFEFYDSGFWSAFTLLCKTVYDEKEAKLSEFTFRALIEMGIDECFILFDQFVDPIEKRKYVLLKTLVDYSSIETSLQPLFNQWFQSLMKEEKSFIEQQFTEKQQAVIQALGDNINKSQEKEYTKALISVRRLCMQVKDQIISKHEQAGHIKISNSYRRMKSGEAHTIHGNIFLLPHRLKQQTRENHLFRVYTYLFFSGIEALTRVINFLKNDEFSKEAGLVLEDLNKFKIVFTKAWETHPKTH